ncbi:MAG: ABC transporter permease [Proteobacteria bacterium]|nr:ABC transporter permease [Pseudomonadota bacterium]
MLKYFATRLLTMIPVIVLVSMVVFSIMHIIPGDPAYAILGVEATDEAVAALKKTLGLDRNILVQYFRWAANALRGDLGRSIITNEKVLDIILYRAPVSFYLAVLSILFSAVIALPVGIVAGVKPNSTVDIVSTPIAMVGIAMPGFLLAYLLILVFAFKLELLPLMGYVPISEGLWNSLKHMILPAVTIGLYLAAINARFIRSSMLEVMGKEYITTARAKGFGELGTIGKHALKNALSPVMTVLGIQLGGLLGGAVVSEHIFAIPGIGRLFFDAILEADYPVVQGVVLFMAVCVLTLNLMVDMLYSALDPRIGLKNER